MTDSSTGGYLVPTSGAPVNDDALADLLQTIVVGVTGLAGQFVRPRWQAEPPDRPDISINWAAVGVMSRKADTYAVEAHDGTGQGSDTVTRHEELTVMVSFYGPNCEGNASLLRDGLAVAQNREAMETAGLGLVSIGDFTRNADLINNRWWQKVDVTFYVRRQVDRTYSVLNLLSAGGTVVTSTGLTDTFNAQP